MTRNDIYPSDALTIALTVMNPKPIYVMEISICNEAQLSSSYLAWAHVLENPTH